MFPLIVSGQILELPYEGKELSMIIMLPNEIEDDTTGLEKVRHVNFFFKKAHLKNEKDESQIIHVSLAGEGAHLQELCRMDWSGHARSKWGGRVAASIQDGGKV